MNRGLFYAFAVAFTIVANARAGEYRCPRCGSCQHKSVCRPKCEMREKVSYEYEMVCEPVCLPGPSEACGKKCVPDDRCRGFHWETIWKPRCGCVREKRTLTKVPVKKQEPVYSCEYHCVCCRCGYEEGDKIEKPEPTPPEPESPEPPAAEEKIVEAPAHPGGAVPRPLSRPAVPASKAMVPIAVY